MYKHTFLMSATAHILSHKKEREIRVMRLHGGGKACVNTCRFSVFERTIDRPHVGGSPCFISDLRTIPTLQHEKAESTLYHLRCYSSKGFNIY